MVLKFHVKTAKRKEHLFASLRLSEADGIFFMLRKDPG